MYCGSVGQGHSRSLIFVPIESPYAGWRRGVVVERRTRDRAVAGSSLSWALRRKTLGKFLTPMCLCHQAL